MASLHRKADGFVALASVADPGIASDMVGTAHAIQCLTAPGAAADADPAWYAAIEGAADDLRMAVHSARIHDERLETGGSSLRSPADELREHAREFRASGEALAKLRARLLRSSPQHSLLSAMRRYALLEPPGVGDRVTGWISPRPFPAVLDVAAPSHGAVRVGGLARYFPAHTVHAEHSAAVVAASSCTLRAIDHYHLHRVSVSLDPLLTPGTPGNIALGALISDPSPSGVARFRRSMRSLAGPHEQRETQVSLPVRPACRTSVASVDLVQLGDGSRLDLSARYVAEETELPAIELLAARPRLVHALALAITEPESTAAARNFLRHALHAAGCIGELALLDHSTSVKKPDTSVFTLFGVSTVSQASAVMVGHGNTLRTGARIHRGTLSPGTVRDDLERLRRQHMPQAEAGTK